MKSIILIALILAFFICVPIFTCAGGCADSKRLCDKAENCQVYEPCGFFDQDDCKDPKVKYKVSVGNIIASIIFVESIFVPIILTGWYLWEPVDFK